MDEARWIGPGEALEPARAGELELSFPTIKHLEELRDFADADDGARDAAGRPRGPADPAARRRHRGHASTSCCRASPATTTTEPLGGRRRRRPARRERLHARVPGAGRVGGDVRLLELARTRTNSLPALARASSSSSRLRSRRRQRKYIWRSEAPKSTSRSIVVAQSRKPGLNSSRSAIGSWLDGHRGEEALVELDALELDPARPCACAAARPGVASIDSTSKAGHDASSGRACGPSTRTPPGSTVFERKPPTSRSSAVAAGAPEARSRARP